MAPYASQSRRIRQEWLATEEGVFARARIEDLLGALLSGWPRRSRSMLVMNAGGGQILETLWQAGFDVTGQEDDPEFLHLAREATRRQMDFFVSAPDHLPHNDCSFDYAVALAALEFWQNPEAVLEELARVVCSGVILILPNRFSLCGLHGAFSTPHPLFQYPDSSLPSLKALWRLTHDVFGKKNIVGKATLCAPIATWKPGSRLARLNATLPFLPLGAVVGLRIDFAPLCSGTPLLLRVADPVATAK